MPSLTLYIAMTIDGFIARKNGSVDFLSIVEGTEDYGYEAFVRETNAIIMGRTTYDWIQGESAWPYEAPTYVLTNRPFETEHASPCATVDELLVAIEPYRSVWVCGGAGLITELLDRGLIDRFIISIVPVIIGTGIPLDRTSVDTRLKLVRCESFPTGLVQIEYALQK